ncbi:MAG TPA: SRPBCC family protein [Solirubrobacteraceae bacterium]|nr:SRPBCC family protein [Solirubrobacteraceae bacterium]
MKLEQSFEVTAPLERVWEALVDVERVAPCLPGAEVTGRNEDGSYDGTFKVKIGPTAAAYSGKLHMDEIDESAHTATMHAQGTDRRGQGGAKATIVSSVASAGEGSARVEVVTDYHITGRLARFGRGGMIEEISNRLLTEFANSLQQMLAGDGPPAQPAPAPAAAEPAAAPQGDASEAATSATPPAADEIAGAELAAVVPEADPATETAPAAAAAPEPAAAPGPAAAQPAVDQPAAAQPAAAQPAAAQPAAAQPAAAQPAESPFPGSTPPPASSSEPIQGLSLVSSVMWSRLKRNPAPVVALVLGFLLALRMLRRR